MISRTFGKLTVVEPAGKTRWNELLWACRCECGGNSVVQGKLLRAGKTRSCGCLVNGPGKGVTHGGRYTRLYRIWRGLRTRCLNPKAKDYPRYGGAGVVVCAAWRDSFAAFREWALAACYSDCLFIDRIDSAGNYEPANCRWVTPADSARNTRAVRLDMDAAARIRQMVIGGMSHGAVADAFGVSRPTVSHVCEGKSWA